MPRKESNTPSKRYNTPSKHDIAIKKAHVGSNITPTGGKSHRLTNSGQSTKMTKAVDSGKLRQVMFVPTIWQMLTVYNRSDSMSTVPTKKGSFAVSEDLSVPEEGKYGTSFSSYSSSFTHKGSIFDEPPADTLVDHAMKGFESSSFGSKECSLTSGAISASPERRDSNTTAREPGKLSKKKKKKLKSTDLNAVTTAGTSDRQTTSKMASGAVDAEALKSDDLVDPDNDASGSLSQMKTDPKRRGKASPTNPVSNKGLIGMDEIGTRAPSEKSTKVNRGSPRKLATDEGSPKPFKKNHGKTDSNTSSFGIETGPKKYEGYELSMNKITNSSGEVPHSEARNQTKIKFSKRNRSNIDLKENTHSERALPFTDVNILTNPTHWPSLGEGKSSRRIDQNTASQTTVALLNPAAAGCLVTARRNSMAAIISQKTRIVPAVPLLLQSVTATETRSVSGGSGKRYFILPSTSLIF